MEPDQFRQWRKSLGWKQKDAAERLGLKKRVIQYYEKGDRDGKVVAIPTSVELACLALALGHESWDAEVAARAIESRSSKALRPEDPPIDAVAALDGEPSGEGSGESGVAEAGSGQADVQAAGSDRGNDAEAHGDNPQS